MGMRDRSGHYLNILAEFIFPHDDAPTASAHATICEELKCEVSMPEYDHVSHDCRKPFEIVLTLPEHDKKKVACPHCGSKHVEQEAAAFFAVTGKKS